MGRVLAIVTPGLTADLQAWKQILANCSGRPYLRSISHHSRTSGFWHGLISESDAALDAASLTSDGVLVFTTDASGPRGGASWCDLRLTFAYTQAESARGSNWRELDTVLRALQQSGPQLKAISSCALVRSDNKAADSAINTGYSSVQQFNLLAQHTTQLTSELGIPAASHILGIANGLADALSRWRPSDDPAAADWQLSPDMFDAIEAAICSHDTDTCCSPMEEIFSAPALLTCSW